MTDKCENCRFFDSEISNGPRSFGECQRHPPTSNKPRPEVHEETWCGEFQPKEPDPVQSHFPGRAEAERLKKFQDSHANPSEGNPVLKINMDTMVEVELTEHGMDVLDQHYTDTGIRMHDFKRPLGQIFNIFGPSCYNGADNVFVDNVITIKT